MPSRLSIPKLSLFSSRHSPSSSHPTISCPEPALASPSKKSYNVTPPLSPPARLHLRNILPASPDLPAIMPPPPRTPRSWVWQCHRCMNVYRLGCTRRCLDCSHTYCISNKPKAEKNSRGKKKRRHSGMCAAEFDYVGWEQWGSWRRKVLGFETKGRCEQAARDRAFLLKEHNCFVDCDSPSECCHRRFELLKRRENCTNEPKSPSIIVNLPRKPDDELPLNEAIELAEVDKVLGEETSPMSPLKSSFNWDDIELGEKQTGDAYVWWVEGVSSENNWPEETQDPSQPEIEEKKSLAKYEYTNGRSDSLLIVRNLAEDEIVGDSDSDPESDSSDSSSASCH
ncbi:hypothetical protein GGS20DRAFT_580793 [Poronia punctata]|nr:hypothetical protein GGS20DRAFT_580793 [Poronia punctata]